MKKDKIIGILGGMGSLATAYYFKELVIAQPAQNDQDYYRIIVDNHSQIPDRTEYLLHQGTNPIRALTSSVTMLNQAQVTHAFMPCFTAHFFYQELNQLAHFKFISAFDVLAAYINSNPSIQTVGILSTEGTQQVGLFDQHLPHVKIIYPDLIHQELITNAIYDKEHGIKANKIDDQTIYWLNTASSFLTNQGVDCIIAGCTEVSMMKNHPKIKDEWLDPMMLVIDELLLKE